MVLDVLAKMLTIHQSVMAHEVNVNGVNVQSQW